jgi:hypothetical protein
MTTTDTTLEHAAAAEGEAHAAEAGAAPWTARRFFEALRALSPLRVISPSGPSLFEAICTLGPFGVADGHLNAITPEYHWHLRLDGVRHVRSKDETHARSGRRVLFFELREEAGGGEPFLWIYLHRGKGEEFDPVREGAFAALHRVFAEGRELEVEP